ncbi:1-deoxy-D-xylulose-5-phosphate reductoisomerase [Aeribacillus composti]|uniref:1-deoxy-D-xylulose-5-phosphate reductoisomerase n=1 Tax=Aeribacillus TaxID=1055323 RepID=UPI0007B49811|nr:MULTISPECIES: 1-deoxy-D-xylulose-5-phosphate reductoisomerase [Aeribacillus]KZM57945.1 1-deoxy-D-xylulose-5-phosphate reductoisomerase [Aeribacillus pallidus]MED0649169.1 1-deoxy-D-xylulose-5-phosphate reductoisomerase [Aeribacillus composti]MED4486244.1 1-deoxy-D-xylulose-5-phosphate reductoisomerase [Aeribacillus pallidus]BBU39786.1 1-deoxy-D-xylulose 5-phosphate reductoisomerase [Aeribacillus pallidus]
MKKIILLGATGSIGQQTLDVIRANPDSFRLVAMSFGENIELGLKAVHEFKPELVAVKNREIYDQIRLNIPSSCQLTYGHDGLCETAVYHKGEIVVNAVIGSVGLIPTLKAIEAKKTVALANKETLVTAGQIVTDYARKHNVQILPVDSEHSAIFQCLNGEKKESVERLILTASGGSFRDKSRNELKHVTVKEALNHPNWSMGAKITIDSATMMNKGLEVIEAHWLFSVSYDQIDVLLHKESVIHSMVEFHDGSIIAQLGTPDMKIPIQYALTYPNRIPSYESERLDLTKYGQLHFEKIDFDRYRCLKFAFDSGKIGGTMPAVLNAANEVAVNAFLEDKIPFLKIEELVERALEEHAPLFNPTLEDIQEADGRTRQFVQSLIN